MIQPTTLPLRLRSASALSALTVALLATACSSTPEQVGNVAHGEPKPTTVASIEAKQVAAEQEAAYVVEVLFAKNSAKVSPEAAAKIEAMFKNVPDQKRVKGVKIISWADDEYPSTGDKKLSSTQVDLAKERLESVQRIVKDRHAGLQFELVNMAKRPGPFSKLVGTEDARIKESLERAGVSTTEDKAASKARKAIILLVMKEGKS